MHVCMFIFISLLILLRLLRSVYSESEACMHFYLRVTNVYWSAAGSDNNAPSAPGLQARRRIPWGCAMPVPPPLPRAVPSTQRLSVRLREPRPVDAACTVRTPTRRRRRRMCMPCRCMPNPPLATGNRTRHVCAADNLQTRCKQQALRSYPQGNRSKPGRIPANACPQRL